MIVLYNSVDECNGGQKQQAPILIESSSEECIGITPYLFSD
jgi:hypothetical protein